MRGKSGRYIYVYGTEVRGDLWEEVSSRSASTATQFNGPNGLSIFIIEKEWKKELAIRFAEK